MNSYVFKVSKTCLTCWKCFFDSLKNQWIFSAQRGGSLPWAACVAFRAALHRKRTGPLRPGGACICRTAKPEEMPKPFATRQIREHSPFPIWAAGRYFFPCQPKASYGKKQIRGTPRGTPLFAAGVSARIEKRLLPPYLISNRKSDMAFFLTASPARRRPNDAPTKPHNPNLSKILMDSHSPWYHVQIYHSEVI